jgi:alpha-ketoglutarate-dependent taurine dioxygenase
MYPITINGSNQIPIEIYINQNKPKIFSKLKVSGAILFRNFRLNNIDDFYNTIKCFHEDFVPYLGGDSPRTKLKGNIYTSTEYPADQEISMHQEKSFSNTYPRVAYFFCDIEPKVGGETPILDSRILYKQLRQDIIKKFSTKKLKYVMNLHSGGSIGKSWQQTFEVNTKLELEDILKNLGINYKWKKDDLLEVYEIVDPIIQHPDTKEWVFFSQAHQWHKTGLDKEILELLKEVMPEEDFYHNCYYGDGSEIETEYLEEIRDLINKNKVVFKWQKGDLLMLDNIISMHGRNPFSGERKILVAMS